jgi:hypothetical protein
MEFAEGDGLHGTHCGTSIDLQQAIFCGEFCPSSLRITRA